MIEMNILHGGFYPMKPIFRTSVAPEMKLKRGEEIEMILDNHIPSGKYELTDLMENGELFKRNLLEACQLFPEINDAVHKAIQKSLMEDNPQDLKTEDDIVNSAIKHGSEHAEKMWKLSKRCIEKRAKKCTDKPLGELRRDYIDHHIKKVLETTKKKWGVKGVEETLKKMGVTGSIRPNEIKKSLERLNTDV